MKLNWGGKKMGKIKTHPYQIGKNYLIRTVTMIQVGKLKKVFEKELVLSSASWIADTGRFSNCLKDGTFNEVEPFPDGEIIVGREAIIDAVIFQHEPPNSQK